MAMALLTHTATATTANASIARPQLPSLTATPQQQFSRLNSVSFGARLRKGALANERNRRSLVSMAALPDLHSFTVLAMDLVNLTDLPVRIELDPTREIITDRSTWELSETAIKSFYMAFSLVFCWGCCVFGSMNDVFYDGEAYRKAGGNGTGHWIYEQMDREERAAKDEMWAEDLLEEIEEKAEEVRRAEEEEEKEKENEVELV